MFKKIGILIVLISCFALTVEAQKSSKDAQRKAREKEMRDQRKGKTSDKTKGESNDEKWTDRLVVGGGLGLGYSNGWNINVTPSVGYKITEEFWAGLGLDYYFYSYDPPGFNYKIKNSVVGPRLFALYYVTPQINLGSEFSRATVTQTQTENNIKTKFKGETDSWLVGGGYTQRMGGRGGIRLELYYDVLYDDTDPFNYRTSAFVPRINVFYGL